MSGSTVECRLARAARRFPTAIAVVSPNEALTYAALDERVTERARALQRQGIGERAWTTVRLTGSVAGIVDWFALLRAGALPLPLSPRLPETALGALHLAHPIAHHLALPGGDATAVHPAATAPRPGELCRQFAVDAACAGVATSGSTGTPRIAVHSYANHLFSAAGSASLIPLAPGDRYLLSLPLNHVGGLAVLFRTVTAGATAVVGGRAEDAAFLHAFGITHVSMVETQLRRLLDSDAALPSSLRCALLGGGPVSADLLTRAHALGLPCWLSYGLTEMASQVVTHHPEGGAVVLPYRRLRIAADGEIWVGGETRFLGYLEEGRTVPAHDDAGWFATRDLGRWRGERFEVIGRKDNQFISGGENIQPEAIETVLREHPQIEQAVVVPRADTQFGQRPVAYLDGPSLPADDALREWLRTRLAGYMVPVAFHRLPPGDGLKVQRRALIDSSGRSS